MSSKSRFQEPPALPACRHSGSEPPTHVGAAAAGEARFPFRRVKAGANEAPLPTRGPRSTYPSFRCSLLRSRVRSHRTSCSSSTHHRFVSAGRLHALHHITHRRGPADPELDLFLMQTSDFRSFSLLRSQGKAAVGAGASTPGGQISTCVSLFPAGSESPNHVATRHTLLRLARSCTEIYPRDGRSNDAAKISRLA